MQTADFPLIRTLIVVCNPADAGSVVTVFFNRVLSMSVIALRVSRRGLRPWRKCNCQFELGSVCEEVQYPVHKCEAQSPVMTIPDGFQGEIVLNAELKFADNHLKRVLLFTRCVRAEGVGVVPI